MFISEAVVKIRSLILSLCMCIFFFVFAYADTNIISRIVVEGLKNVKEKTVLSEIHSKKGKPYSKENVMDDLRSILSLDSFDDGNFTFDENTGDLIFSLSEKPFLEDIVFRGNFEFSKTKLKIISDIKEQSYFDTLKLEETKKKILKLYIDRGYADCSIEVYPTIDVDTNKMTVTFLITENNKILIDDVKIEGAISYPQNKILKLMKKIKPKRVFSDENFQKDLAAIESFYKNNGFIDYKLVSSTSSYNNVRTKISLSLNISEGNKYKIGEISFDGNSVLDYKDLNKILKFKKGQIFNKQKITETREEIVEAYANKGYVNAQIIPEFQRNGNIVNVDWNIKENSIVYVGNIYIEGLESTKEKVIRREILLKPKNVFSRKKLIGSVQRIRNLGFIDIVEPHIIPTGAPNILDLAFEIEEGRPGNINMGAGYSSVDEFILSLGLMHLNLFGLGQHLDASFEGGKKKMDFSVTWTEPYIVDKNMSLSLSVFDLTRKKDYSDVVEAYKEHRQGFSASVGPRINPLVNLIFGYRYEDVKLSNIKDSVKNKIEADSDLSKDKISSIFTQIIYDCLDYRYDPTRGSRQSLGISVAGTYLGGEVDFVKTVLKSSWFFPVFWKFVFSTRLEVGSIVSYGSSVSAPIYEKFYIGGAESVRGYKYRTEIGPEKGGNYKAVLNFEYKFPMLAEKGNSILVGALFYDIGGDWGRYGTVKWLGSGENNLRSSSGFEIRIATPVFPVRIGWAYGFNHKEGEKLQDFYFSIGVPM